MALDNKQIGELLVKENYVSERDLKEAERSAAVVGRPITEYLIDHGIITKDLFGQAVAEHYSVAYADLNTVIPTKEQVTKIPEELARQYNIVLFRDDPVKPVVATDDPDKAAAAKIQLNQLLKATDVSFAFALPEDIESVFVHYRAALETRFSKIVAAQKRVAPEIVEEIIADALILRASDVHFEPQDKELVIRFRIDGILHEAGRMKLEHYPNILNRIKVLAKLRTDEHSRMQDGAIRYSSEKQRADLRVAIAPTVDGEKIVLRVLSEYVRNFTLADLGLSSRNQDVVSTTIKKPFGMILSTGPTGSGKTTTMYAVLKLLNKPGVNIATIEDPVEYKILGINHMQVNEGTDITFAHGLRSIVRQDPDIILVGEIRDQETAEISINAALTGHLLLTTFHANDAATAIPRLLDMGIEPYLLASALQLIVAQRLVRRLCESCRFSYEVHAGDLRAYGLHVEKYFKTGAHILFRAKGCSTCNNTGYRGRIAVFESIAATPELQELILKRPSSKEVWALARKQGTLSLFEDGVEKVRAGITTLDELLRVVEP